MAEQQPPPSKKPLAAAALIAAAVAIAAPLASQWEGFAAKPYLDPAKILTVCYGETEGVEARIYSKDECAAKLRARMARDYAPRILACLPQLTDRPHVFGALLDAAYNAGPAAVCRSPMAVAVRQGAWSLACEQFPGWYVSARYHGKPLPPAKMRANGWHWNGKAWVKRFRGLERRRIAEARVCMVDVQ